MLHHTSTIRRICALLAVLAITLSVFTVIPLTASAAEPASSGVQSRTVMDNAYISKKIAEFKSNRYPHNSTYRDDPNNTGGYECFGFANEIAKYIFGSYPTYYMSAAYVYPGWTVEYGGSAIDHLQEGDIVRYWYHSIFITKIDGDTITYCQANVPSGTNRVTYGNTITRKELKSRVSQQLTSGGTTKTGWVAHCDKNMSTTAHVHTPLKQPAVAPTCTSHGLTAGSYCSECFYNIDPQEIILALGHNYVASVTVPTCTKEGYTTHTCDRCGDSYTDSRVPARGHTPGAAASCTSNQTCTTCGAVVKNKLDHSYTAKVTAPTCTAEGYTTHTCNRCGDSYTDSRVSAKGHTPGAAATCTSNQTCTTCGTVVKNKLGHSYTAKVTAPTCTKEGYTTHTCDRCGDSYTDSRVSAKGHTPAAIPAIPTTCTESGKTEGSKCSVCGEILACQTTVAPLSHTEEILPAKEATCTEAGLTAGARCEVCGDTLISQKEIPAKGHTEVMDPAKAPTCTEAGLAEGKHCSVCGEVLTAQNVVLAIGHTPGDWATTVEPAVGTEGKRQQSCVTCGGILHEETIPALPEETEPITEPETDPVTEPDTAPKTHPEAETPPVTETPSADPATTEDPTAKEPSTAPTVTVGCSGSVLSCGLLMLVTLAGTALVKRRKKDSMA